MIKKIFIWILVFSLINSISYAIDNSQTYSYNSKMTKDGNLLNYELYGGIRFVNDNGWKTIESAESLKNSPVKCIVKSDGVTDAVCLDYNYTSIKVEVALTSDAKDNFDSLKNFKSFDKYPISIVSQNETSFNFTKKQFDKYIKKLDYYSIDTKDKILTLTLDAKFGDVIHVGPDSTTIELKEPDSEVLDDTCVQNTLPDTTYCANASVIETYHMQTDIVNSTFRFDISSVDCSLYNLNNAILTLHKVSHLNNCSVTYRVWNATNITWREETLTYSNIFTPDKNIVNFTSICATSNNAPFSLVVSQAVNSSCKAGDPAITFLMDLRENFNSPHFNVHSKETATPEYYPSLNVTLTLIAGIDLTSVGNVSVLPSIPNLGDDLLCNYTYHSIFNYSEKGSTYKWFKNGVNQNLNYETLAKGNLSLNDKWYCTIMPSDGLTNGTEVSSSNVTIRTTVSNLKMYVENTNVWNRTGYLSGSEYIENYESTLQSAIDNCVADAQGYCNITLKFSSDTNGTLNLSNFEAYYVTSSAAVCENLINTTNKSDWDLGTYNQTIANASGILMLNKSLLEINSNLVSLNELAVLLHFNNLSSEGENTTLVKNYAGFDNATCSPPSCPSVTNTAKIDKSRDFDGIGDVLTINEFGKIRYVGGNISFGSWINPDFELTAAGDKYVLNKHSGTVNAYHIRLESAIDQYRCMVRVAGVNKLCDTTLPSGYTTAGSWNHISCVKEGGNLKVYWNGKNNNTCPTGAGNIASGTGNLFIGSSTAGGANLFDGEMDELFMFNRSLTASEISTIYNNQLNLSYPNGDYTSKVFGHIQNNTIWSKVYWSSFLNNSWEIGNYNNSNLAMLLHLNNNASFGENTTFVYDHTGNGYNAVCISPNCPAFINNGKLYGAFNFNSSDILNITASNLNLSNNFTVSLWVNFDTLSDRYGIIRDLSFNSEDGWKVYYDNVLNKFAFRQSCNTVSAQKYSDLTVNSNQWYHLVYRVENSLGQLFINNVAQSNTTTQQICDNPSAITLGYDFLDATGDIFLDGTLDEIGIWQRSLSNNEIYELYKAGYTKASLQLRTCDDLSCSGESFIGNYTSSPAAITSNIANNTYLQYKLFMETINLSLAPEVDDVIATEVCQ
ncbi:MAG TPA: LamG domain-containing protein [Candidatus Nanoarchaeia archaeon]|nr:LamG domain-containing protein [Candidatus Nanoarchaeia archaeon]